MDSAKKGATDFLDGSTAVGRYGETETDAESGESRLGTWRDSSRFLPDFVPIEADLSSTPLIRITLPGIFNKTSA